jgi:hypothetical protein
LPILEKKEKKINSMFTSIFGASKGPEPAELAKQWKRELAKEARKLERDMGHLKREEQKSMNECKKLCKEGGA